MAAQGCGVLCWMAAQGCVCVCVCGGGGGGGELELYCIVKVKVLGSNYGPALIQRRGVGFDPAQECGLLSKLVVLLLAYFAGWPLIQHNITHEALPELSVPRSRTCTRSSRYEYLITPCYRNGHPGSVHSMKILPLFIPSLKASIPIPLFQLLYLSKSGVSPNDTPM